MLNPVSGITSPAFEHILEGDAPNACHESGIQSEGITGSASFEAKRGKPMSVRFRICLAAWAATILCSAFCSSSNADAVDDADEWTIEISPAYRISGASAHVEYPPAPLTLPNADEAGEVVQPLPTAVCNTPGADYRRIYDSIPFNRAEYNVNPSYRHDSTMEILTGNARHQTIVTHETRPIRNPWPSVTPYRYNNLYRGFQYYPNLRNRAYWYDGYRTQRRTRRWVY